MIFQKTNFFLIFFLSIFSFFINKYYANIGVEPMDTFVLYNGGYKVLNGLIPFQDYWLTTGPLMDYINAFFFWIGGVNWSTYTTHSSIFNSIITVLTYLFFNALGSNKYFSFFFSLMFSLLMYPIIGTPFVDHHSTIFLLISFYLFIVAIKKENFKLFIYLPTILIIAFLCKQTPAAYGIITISLLGLALLLISNKKREIIIYSLYGLLLGLFLILIFFILTEIPYHNFYTQYLLYGSSIGSYRMESFDIDILGVLHQYKFIFLPIFFGILIVMKGDIKNNKRENLIFISFLALFFLFLFHQLLTLNENFIFFLIPIIYAINQIYLKKIFPKFLFIQYLLISICIFSVVKYHVRFNEKRKFNTLEYVNLNLAIDAKTIHNSLSGLQWITREYKDNPLIEVNGIKESLNILSKQEGKYMLLTNYLFISPVLKTNDFSPNQWHHPDVSFPIKGRKDFFMYKKFFTEKLEKNEIVNIFTVGNDLKNILSLLYDKECFTKTKLGYFTYKYRIIKSCKNLYEYS